MLNLAKFILPQSYICPFKNNYYADVALGENKFNTSDLK